MLNWRSKLWVKAIAWSVVIAFLPEQVAWAVDYNWRGMLKGQIASSVSQAAVAADPSALKEDAASIKLVADSVKDALNQLINKQVTDIQLSRGVTVHRPYPLSLSE